MKRIFILSVFLCLLTLPMLGCAGDATLDPTVNLPIGRVQAINVIPGVKYIDPGDIYRFEARGIFPGGAVGDVTFLAAWFIDDTTIAEIIGPGLVRAKMPGLAHVHCTYDGVTSSTVTVAVPGVPLEEGIVPIHVEVSPGSLSVPIEEYGTLSFVPTPATPEEMALPNPKPAFMYALGDDGVIYPDFYWIGATLRVTSGAGAGLEFEIINNSTAPYDTIPGDTDHPYGPDWMPDGIAVFVIEDDFGFPYDLGVAEGDSYMASKRWMQFEAEADYSDGSTLDVTYQARWHLSDPTYGYITATGYFNSTSAKPANLIVYCEFAGLISNYVPINVH